MKEARKALETSSLGRKPRFRLSQLIQSVLMTRTTTEVREMRTVLKDRKEGEEKNRHSGEGTGRVMTSNKPMGEKRRKGRLERL